MEKTSKLNLELPTELYTAITKQAEREYTSRAAILRKSAAIYLQGVKAK